MPTRGAKVLHVIQDGMPGADAAFYEYACVMNLENWEFVPDSMRSDKIFDAMLASPWNAPAATPARIPPLVLQLGPREDCDNDARVLAAVRHSGYNLQFASVRLRADATVVAWAAAIEDVKQVTVRDARDINTWCQFVLNREAPSNVPHEEMRERCQVDLRCKLATLSLTTPRHAPEGLPVPACKAAAYFAVPAPMRERLWPWRQRHLEIFAQLQREGKMPTPPSHNKSSRQQAPACAVRDPPGALGRSQPDRHARCNVRYLERAVGRRPGPVGAACLSGCLGRAFTPATV